MLRYFSYLLLMSLVFGLMGCPFAGDPLPLIPVAPVKTGKTSYKSRIAVHSFSPDTVRGNGELTIRGAGFSPVQSDNQAYLNGKAAQVLRGSDTTLVVRVPEQAGTGTVEVQTGGQRVAAEKMMIYGWTTTIEKVRLPESLYGWKLGVDKLGNFYIPNGFFYTYISKYSPSGRKLGEIGFEPYGSRTDHTIDLVRPVVDENNPDEKVKFHILADYYSSTGMVSYVGELKVDFKADKVEREEWPGMPKRLLVPADFKLVGELKWLKSGNLYSAYGVQDIRYLDNELLLSGSGIFIKYVNNQLVDPPGPTDPFLAAYAGKDAYIVFQGQSALLTSVYRVNANGNAVLWAGNGMSQQIDGYREKAGFRKIVCMRGDETGRIFILDNTTLRMITPDGFVQTLTEVPCNQLCVGVDGRVYAYQDNDNTIYRLTIQ